MSRELMHRNAGTKTRCWWKVASSPTWSRVPSIPSLKWARSVTTCPSPVLSRSSYCQKGTMSLGSELGIGVVVVLHLHLASPPTRKTRWQLAQKWCSALTSKVNSKPQVGHSMGMKRRPLPAARASAGSGSSRDRSMGGAGPTTEPPAESTRRVSFRPGACAPTTHHGLHTTACTSRLKTDRWRITDRSRTSRLRSRSPNARSRSRSSPSRGRQRASSRYSATGRRARR